jgi:hypothetical protein
MRYVEFGSYVPATSETARRWLQIYTSGSGAVEGSIDAAVCYNRP